MPVEIKKVDGYRVSTPGGVKAKGTTKKKAEAQRRLLRGVEHGWKPTGKPVKKYPKGKAKKVEVQRSPLQKQPIGYGIPLEEPTKEHPEGKAVKSYGGWKKR